MPSRRRPPAVIAIGRFGDLHAGRLWVAGSAAGAVLVGAGERGSAIRSSRRAGSLLASAIVDELSRPLPEHGDSLLKISAFYQLLHAAIAPGSDREGRSHLAEA